MIMEVPFPGPKSLPYVLTKVGLHNQHRAREADLRSAVI